MARVVVGQDEVVDAMLVTLLARGHALLGGRAGSGQDAARVERRAARSA